MYKSGDNSQILNVGQYQHYINYIIIVDTILKIDQLDF